MNYSTNPPYFVIVRYSGDRVKIIECLYITHSTNSPLFVPLPSLGIQGHELAAVAPTVLHLSAQGLQHLASLLAGDGLPAQGYKAQLFPEGNPLVLIHLLPLLQVPLVHGIQQRIVSGEPVALFKVQCSRQAQ